MKYNQFSFSADIPDIVAIATIGSVHYRYVDLPEKSKDIYFSKQTINLYSSKSRTYQLNIRDLTDAVAIRWPRRNAPSASKNPNIADIIFMNDGSFDKSGSQITSYYGDYDMYMSVVIKHSNNSGDYPVSWYDDFLTIPISSGFTVALEKWLKDSGFVCISDSEGVFVNSEKLKSKEYSIMAYVTGRDRLAWKIKNNSIGSERDIDVGRNWSRSSRLHSHVLSVLKPYIDEYEYKSIMLQRKI